MLTIETERRVSKFFSTLLNYELLSQKAKNELISNELFNPYQCFKAIDKNNKRKMSGQNTLRPVQLRVWRERKHN